MASKTTPNFDPSATCSVVSPWLERDDWADGRVVDSQKATAKMDAVICIAIAMVGMAPLGMVAMAALGPMGLKVDFLVIPVIEMSVVSLVVVAIGMRYVARWRRFSGSMFQMASVPGEIGATLAGVARAAWKVDLSGGVVAELTCFHQVIIGVGKTRRTHKRKLWGARQTISVDLAQGDPCQTAIPVQFDIPRNCEPTDTSDRRNSIIWQLRISTTGRHPSYTSLFDLPVFRMEEKAGAVAADPIVLAAPRRKCSVGLGD